MLQDVFYKRDRSLAIQLWCNFKFQTVYLFLCYHHIKFSVSKIKASSLSLRAFCVPVEGNPTQNGLISHWTCWFIFIKIPGKDLRFLSVSTSLFSSVSSLSFKSLLLCGSSFWLCAYSFPCSSPTERDYRLLEVWQGGQFPWFWKGPIYMTKPIPLSISMWRSKWIGVDQRLGGKSVCPWGPCTRITGGKYVSKEYQVDAGYLK